MKPCRSKDTKDTSRKKHNLRQVSTSRLTAASRKLADDDFVNNSRYEVSKKKKYTGQ